ncbi:golgin subfamily A member 6-like protein 2 [Aethina tumida]|uniref:golgin subfamily A member 6-like protein 2 n=1 Tax=Aethina tumida TaxID=116153 RepID=UPI002148FA92|nr:golgin subfamily A member 6-like protein 2 [Aethina tumida]XP_049816987.1 golgin subfamily A member 6-like protein 2 [Aethina tumida]
MLENRLESNVNLNSVICELEKSEKLFIEQLSKYEDFTMDKFVEDVERRREKEYENVKSEVRFVVEKLQEKLKNFQNNKFPSIEALPDFKKEMLELQTKITNLKQNSQQTLAVLKMEEKNLTKDLQKISESIDLTRKQSAITIKIPKMEAAINESGDKINKVKETKDFMDFVHLVSDECGLTFDDFTMFLNVAKNNDDIYDVLTTVSKQKPEIPEEIWLRITEFYIQFNEMRNRKPKKLMFDRKNSEKRVDNFLNLETMKENLLEWKLKKEEKKKTVEAYDKFMERERKRLNEQERKRRDYVKNMVNLWKLENERRNIENREANRVEKTLKSREINKEIKQFQKRDEIYLRNKMRLTEKVKKQRESVKRTPKTKSSKLMMNTKQFMNRIKKTNEKKDKPTEGNIRNIQKLAIPQWRKGLL